VASGERTGRGERKGPRVFWLEGCNPRCFRKRGCKVLKTKDRGGKKSAKRLQDIEASRVRAGTAGGVREVSPREHVHPYYYRSGRLSIVNL